MRELGRPTGGDHGEMTTVHGHETCHCPPATNAETGEDISCWQTNRERSNRWPNGNIKVYCTVGLCDFDNTGAPVQGPCHRCHRLLSRRSPERSLPVQPRSRARWCIVRD